MLRFPSSLLTCCLAGGLATAVAVPALAQDLNEAGLVRITDNVSAAQGAGGISQAGFHHRAAMAEGTWSECPPEYGPACGRGGKHTFSPPVKRPIFRQGVPYYKMWPNAWAPNSGPAPTNYQYPTVYMPTDTTQLGYYYQHVPYWQPRPGMIPPPPVPSQWHTTVAQSVYSGHHPAGIIYGTAPTAMPMSPAPAGSSGGIQPGNIVPPEPTVSPEPVPAESGAVEPSAGLEKTFNTPALIPTN